MKPLLWFLGWCVITAIPRAEAYGQCANRITEMTRKADTVIVAQVVDAGRAPGFWSGQIAAQQTVTYRVHTVLKGALKQSSFTVDYYVIHGSRLSEKDRPELNKALFKVGDRLLLFLHSRTVHLPNDTERLLVYAESDDDCSVLSPSSAAIEAVRKTAER